MTNCGDLFRSLQHNGVGFFTGVPDSLLKDICAYITDHTDKSEHIIAANEGAAVGLAAGYHLATGKIPLVYFQNSGLGNAVNPLLSLADKEVYGIPMLLMIGWRGEPGKKDEPQHIKPGRVQNALLEAMEIPYALVNEHTTDVADIVGTLIKKAKDETMPVALVVSKGTFEPYRLQSEVKTGFEMSREDAVTEILAGLDHHDRVVSTTGKTSREVFEYRERTDGGHAYDFLTVGSMGHAGQIALGMALHTDKTIICLDGDGAAIMHLGSMAVTGNSGAKNLIHILINNGAHDSVGGQQTVGFTTDFKAIALASGYRQAHSIDKREAIAPLLKQLKQETGPSFLEIKVNKGARGDLGRPTTTPKENKTALMKGVGSL